MSEEQRRCKCGRATVGDDWEESTDSLGRKVWRKAGSSRIVHICMDKTTAQLLRAKQQVGVGESRTAATADLLQAVRDALGADASPAILAVAERLVELTQGKGEVRLRALEKLQAMLSGELAARPAPGEPCPVCHRADHTLRLNAGAASVIAQALSGKKMDERVLVSVPGQVATLVENLLHSDTPAGFAVFCYLVTGDILPLHIRAALEADYLGFPSASFAAPADYPYGEHDGDFREYFEAYRLGAQGLPYTGGNINVKGAMSTACFQWAFGG